VDFYLESEKWGSNFLYKEGVKLEKYQIRWQYWGVKEGGKLCVLEGAAAGRSLEGRGRGGGGMPNREGAKNLTTFGRARSRKKRTGLRKG